MSPAWLPVGPAQLGMAERPVIDIACPQHEGREHMSDTSWAAGDSTWGFDLGWE
ncbi:hypothetical protein ACIP9H_33440 [Streptomyces sp. NPDC088732]|uniref:hypothetical protein n=1 Tax=Streptomyces sp. NPDC088732 TaxID=3365879 RepID=UPI0037F5715F